ncbi:uncharacterized protein BO97DRAFT_450565 [Aspergillus homomorphus CBS 101889]|uniref:RRM domain-containing protein n=1 Tax=Aspergillus homomorphus (strain CBS 101889) TaxID=1450537 RepID=A0A395I1W3_ASPHC|nr:hypothetical protein BO97DRAFT_450565 [Aspergillus homomorphus CBS 101889]RAL13158.1 hypothetical protein BO97DRAFT_450565 [Aspergillus homomorphus CBS 101889]
MSIIHLSHLDHATDAYLNQAFSQHGLHAEAHVITNNEDKSPNSSAFVKIANGQEVGKAMDLINQSHIVGLEATARIIRPSTLYGKTPADAFFSPPTPWGDLYKTEDWDT